MFVSLRRYTFETGDDDALARRLEDEFAPAISQEPAFLGYLAFASGGTLETVSVFADEESARRSDALAAAYVAENLSEFRPQSLGVTGGELLTSRMTTAMLSAARRSRARRARARRDGARPAVLVVGATGRTGRRIVEGLLDRGLSVRALVRDAARGRALLPAGVDLAVGDLRDRASLEAALDGVGSIVVATAGGDRPDNAPVVVDYFGTEHLMQAAAHSDVDLVLYISSIHATRPEHSQDVEPTSLGWKARAEEIVRSSGVPYSIIRAGWLTDGPSGEPLALSQGDTGEGHLSRSDLAEVTVELLFADDARGKTFEIVAVHEGERKPLEPALAGLHADGVR